MNEWIEKRRKLIFYAVPVLSFFCVLAYNILTPYLSDDIAYLSQVRSASGYADIIRMNVGEYISNNCRFIDQLLMRTFFYSGNKIWSDLFGSLLFAGLGLLIYRNAVMYRKYDICIMIMTFLLMWRCLVSFDETILWKAGSASYLYGIMWILSFVTYYRAVLNRQQTKHPLLTCTALFLLGVAAGMSNENTSGGAFLLILFFTLNKIANNRKKGIGLKDSLRPYMIVSHLSILLGIALLVFGPGSRSRKSVVDQSTYSGIVGFFSHVYKITVSVGELLLPLLVMIVIALVILVLQKRFSSFYELRNDPGIVFLTVAVITIYVMAVIEPTSDRVYFGASVFLIIAFVHFVTRIDLGEISFRALKYGFVSVLCMLFVFGYLENLVNLARICREEKERVEILVNAYENGHREDIVVPRYREGWENPYSTAYKNDMERDPGYWINTFYADYYGIEGVYAVPREEWEELYAPDGYLK